MDEIEMKKRLDVLMKDFNYIPQYQVDVMGKKVDVPVKYSDARAFMIFFPISLKKAKDFLGSDRLMPVSIMNGKCVLAITLFNYRDCPVGPYNEFTFSIPVRVDAKFNTPILPLIFDSLFPNFGYQVILMGVSNEISREHINRIFPYPLVDKNIFISLEEKGEDLFGCIRDGNEKIFSVSFKKPHNYKLRRKCYNTYYKKVSWTI